MSDPAIYLNPEAYDTSGPALMGRHSAGEGFLQAYLRYGGEPRHLWNYTGQSRDRLETFLARFEVDERPIHWIPAGDVARLGQVGALQLPSPRLPDHAWIRRSVGDRAYSIVGVTHTTATAYMVDMLAKCLIAPIQPWDGIICTSRAVRASVAAQLEATADHLKSHLGARDIRPPRLETIPLGVDTAKFAPDAEHRAAWRKRLVIPDDGLVVLYVGRFSLTSKMNPIPMAMALERLAKRLGRDVYWVLSGWAKSEADETRFHKITREHCPTVRYRIVNGRDPDNRYSIWSVADIFLSLSDNVQETFGLTPIEAMAAALPSVVSDWDGYKDTVRHGEDGFRVSTYTPRAGRGGDIAHRFFAGWDGYDTYVGQTSQFTAVDVDEAVEALVQLADNPELRRTMGEAARKRAVEVFDWRHILPRYQAFWAELAAIRQAGASAPDLSRNAVENPWALDPYRLFASYPSEWLTAHSQVQLAPDVVVEEAQELLKMPMVREGRAVLPTTDETQTVLAFLAANGQSRVNEVLEQFPSHRRLQVERGLVWLAKYRVVSILGRSSSIPGPVDGPG